MLQLQLQFQKVAINCQNNQEPKLDCYDNKIRILNWHQVLTKEISQ